MKNGQVTERACSRAERCHRCPGDAVCELTNSEEFQEKRYLKTDTIQCIAVHCYFENADYRVC